MWNFFWRVSEAVVAPRPEDGSPFPVRPSPHPLSLLGSSGLLLGFPGRHFIPSYPKPVSVTGSLRVQRTAPVSFEGWWGGNWEKPVSTCRSVLYPRVAFRVAGLSWGQSKGEQAVTVVWASSLQAELS